MIKYIVPQVACVAGGLVRRGKIRFLAEKAATTISGAMLDEFKRKDWGEEKNRPLTLIIGISLLLLIIVIISKIT